MNKLSKRHFWEWFKRNNKEYAELPKRPRKEAAYWLSEMNAHLRAYYKFFEFSMTFQDKQNSALIISVNGRAMHFKKVEIFVATAPEIPGWNIHALQDPMPIDHLLEEQMQETGIDPHELYFSFTIDDPGRTDIVIYHPLCTEENERVFSRLAHGAVYNLLGERSFGMDVGYLEVSNLSCANRNEVQRLEELPFCINSRSSIMVVDDNGKLMGMS